ncbi:MAG: 30S ribosomal protein S9 [Bacteroidales bacterium OttesenSCG-928-I14]|jgi:small subunit ribosomal protein S9|nr:30S ribosomal protein S9 [Bacteroidales bacterium OttesenSCG-928-I14]
MEIVNSLGRRKTAVARIFIKDGSGKISINQRDFKSYFTSPILQYVVTQPLNKLNAIELYDISINLHGGGCRGQSEAVRLGIARALVKINPESKQILKSDGFMTRDSRRVERKKPGRPKARKKFQFSKR